MDAFLELFSTQGRINRAWYFWHVMLDDLVIAGMAAIFILAAESLTGLFIMPVIGIGLAGAWAAMAVTIKRLHDLDRPGWHFLLMAIPIYNIFLGLKLIFGMGTDGENRYGPNPLAVGSGGGRQHP